MRDLRNAGGRGCDERAGRGEGAGRADGRGAVRRRVAVLAAALVATALLAGALAGCRDSDELVEVVYNQSAETIDYDVEQKNYVLSPDAEQTLPLAEATEVVGVESYEHVEETIPVFGIPPTGDTAIEQVLYDENAGASRTAPIFPDKPESEEGDQDEEQRDDEKDEDDDAEGEDEDDVAGPQFSDTAVRGVSSHSDAPKAFNASGNLLAPLEDVQCIATVGEYANLAMMIGGQGTLVAGDDTFLGDENAQRVFSDEHWAFDQIPAVWTYDAASGSYTCDFEALKEADPDMVWVPDGVELLTDEQRLELLQLGIHVEPVPAMSSVESIKEMVRWLGDTLGDGTVSGQDAAATAAAYIDDYLGADVEGVVSENGGLTTYNGVDYADEGHRSNNQSNWCLLVTDWDETAMFNAGIWSSTGIAIARGGYGWSPVNYYLSVGGANNNAAQYPVANMAGKKSGDYYVWQFNMSMLDPARVRGTLAVSSFGETSYGWAQCLVGAPATVNREANFQTTLGADDFRYVVCANQAIAEAFTFARDTDTAAQTGLYAAYDYSVGAALQESGVGPRTADGVLIRSFIGVNTVDGKSLGQLKVEAGENPYEIVTCANGLWCDWVWGSAESFLMAFWTDDFYDGDEDFPTLRAEATRFYKQFYGYELTDEDFAQMCAGKVG